VRILVLNWQDCRNPQAGGAELHLQEIFSRIVARGHTVDLLCSSWPAAPQRETLDGIDVHRVGTRHTYPFLAHRYYRENLARNEYDVVIEDLNKVPLYTPLWGTRKLVALVHHLFGATVFREAPAPLAAAVWLSERPLGVLYRKVPFQAVSRSTADDLVERGIPRGAIRVIYNGVDSDRLTPDASERSADPLFVYLGRLKKYKRVDVKSLDQSSRISFLGFISEEAKLHLLRRAWASTLASPKEGWGISNLEAAACGTPVIAANSPGIRESVIDGETGFLVPPDDPQEMTAAMRGLVQSPDLVNVLGGAARRFAATFTWDRAATETLAHLEEVVGK